MIINKRLIVIISLSLLLLALCMPTLSGDSAFYLTKISAERSLHDNLYKNIWSISYGGIIEYLIRLQIKNTVAFIVIYKIIVILTNYILYRKIFNKKNELEILYTFLVLQFYLSPSEYSYAVGGLSAIVLTTQENRDAKKIFLGLIGLILLGLDLPNPKYLGLGFILYISIEIMKEDKRRRKEIIYVALLIILASGYLIYKFKQSGFVAPPDYSVRNSSGELLDLAGRNFFEAIIPFKANKVFYPLFFAVLIYKIFQLTKLIAVEKISNRVLFVLLINYIVSYGILEPTGILAQIAEINPILSFIRTRAGFDLLFMFFLIYLVESTNKEDIKIEKIEISIILIMALMICIYYGKNFKNLINIKREAVIIDKLQLISRNDGCYIALNKGYTENPIFGFGPHLVRLSTNLRIIYVNRIKDENINLCKIILTDKAVVLPKNTLIKFSDKQIIENYYVYYK